MEQIISKDILLTAGFKDITYDYEKQFHKEHDGLDDYITLRRQTDDVDKNPGKALKLDIDNGLTNSGRAWYLLYGFIHSINISYLKMKLNYGVTY